MRSAALSLFRSSRFGGRRGLLVTSFRCNAPRSSIQYPILASTNNTTVRSITHRTDLLQLIRKEYDEEHDTGRTEMSEDLVELKETIQKNAWKIVDDGGFTKLHRNHNSMKLRVSFHCQDMITENVYDDDEEEEDHIPEPQDEEEDYGVPPGSLRFVATATPTKTGKTLIFQCTSEHGTARIDAVSVSMDTDDIDKIHTTDANYNEYVGPVFDELDEALQEEFFNFLEHDVGVDSDLCTFINSYADYKEQQSYVKFLKNVEKVLE